MISSPNLLAKRNCQAFRRYCSVPVDQVLKKFYKLVHPDMFSQPTQKEVNQKSFGALMNYLDYIKAHNRNTDVAPSNFKLSFYTTSNPNNAINLEVNPPSESVPSKEKKYHLHKTLTTLFSKCNFEHEEFYVDDFGRVAVVERYAKKGDVTLLKFILSTHSLFKGLGRPDLKKLETNLEDYFLGIATKYETIRKYLHLVKNYKIGKFDFSIRSHMFLSKVDRLRKRIELLETFQRCLNKMRNEDNFNLKNIENVTIVFGRYSKIDENGNLELNCADPETWHLTISEYRIAEAEKVKENAKSRLELQQQVIQKLDIANIYADPDVASSMEYRMFLLNFLNDYNRKQHTPLTGLKKIQVKIEKINHPRTEDASHTLVLPITTHVADVREIINQSGPSLIDNQNTIKNNLNLVKKLLDLQNLSWAQSDITSIQLRETVDRLYKHCNSLKPYTSGLKLHISNDYGINEESRTISIRWDYLIDTPRK